MTCTSCGNKDLKRVREGEYLCEYCGSRYYTDEAARFASAEEKSAELAAIFAESAEYEQKDNYRKELEILARGLDIAPDNCTLMLRLGRVYWRLGFTQKALEYYNKAKSIDPDDPIVYVNLGSLYLSRELYAEARTQYEKGLAMIEADPLSATPGDIAVAYGNYALCIGKQGDVRGAKKYLAIAKEKGYCRDSVKNICRQLHISL